MDAVTYAILKSRGSQGSYTSVSDLPANANPGATAVVNGDLYYFNGTEWVLSSNVASAITNAQIDALWP